MSGLVDGVTSSAISWTYCSKLPFLLGKVTRQDMVVPHAFLEKLAEGLRGSTAQLSKARFPGGLGWDKHFKLRFLSQAVNSSLSFSG